MSTIMFLAVVFCSGDLPKKRKVYKVDDKPMLNQYHFNDVTKCGEKIIRKKSS